MASSRTADVRTALQGILEDTWPRPWTTLALKYSFASRMVSAVYPALQQLNRAGLVWSDLVQGVRWWAGRIDGQGPRCRCGREADRLARLPVWTDPGWLYLGGYTCGQDACTLAATVQEWPWPERDPLGLYPDRRVQ